MVNKISEILKVELLKEYRVKGWVRTIRGNKKISFMELYDKVDADFDMPEKDEPVEKV